MKNSCLATLIAFLLIIFLGLFILAAQIKTITNPEFLASAIKKTQVFEELGKSVDTIAASPKGAGQTNLNSIALTKVIIKSIDPALMEIEVAKALTALLNYVQGRSTSIDATIDLTVWKQGLTQKWPEIAPAIFKAEYENLPACKEGEKPNKLVGEDVVIDCKGPGLTADSIEQSTKTADLTPLIKTIPDQLSLSDLVKKNQPLFDKIRLGFNVLNLVFWLTLTLSILSVAGLVSLGWPNWRAICGWHGWIFFIVTAPTLVLEFLGPKIIDLLQPILITKFDPNISKIFTIAAGNLNQTMFQATITPVAIIFITSIILIILSFVLPKYEPKIIPPGFN